MVMENKDKAMTGSSLPALISPKEFALCTIQVNQCRIVVPCDDSSFHESVYEYEFTRMPDGLTVDSDRIGTITQISGSFALADIKDREQFPTWRTHLGAHLCPKSELSVNYNRWHTEHDIKSILLEKYKKRTRKSSDTGNEYYPESESDIDVITINDRLWAHMALDDYRQLDVFMTELDENLVLQINFDASPCWYRDGFAPADVKAHLMTFFMEYLCHFKIIKAGSVPDEELPPLGFYPAAREEKDIDRDGHVVERDPDYSPAPDFSSW
ncbi:MAG: hypothetical protein CMH98_12870 [Oceanospirillaceae bacterium]|nr:hypothetical protein [Oceanospirillaceae bacterium]|tara:strand:+ start:60526 stop:61332 length:807 start_codon:yes stop_codon:yes gene_type:complete